MTALAKRTGPSRIWKTIKGRRVKTNDGRDIGEIKRISENHLLLEQGRIHKHRFWIPKYVADAFDGKVLWLILGEDEIRGRYQYGTEPPTQENYAMEFGRFRETPYGQRISFASDFNENIRVVENYSNIRNLRSTSRTENLGSVKEETDMLRNGENQKEKNIKDIEMSNRENIRSAEHHSKQPVNIDLPRTIQRTVQSVQPIVTDSNHTDSESGSEASVEVEKKKVKVNSSSPIKLPTSFNTQVTQHVEGMDRDRESRSLSVDLAASPVRITSNEFAPIHQTISPYSTTSIGKPENVSAITSPLSPLSISQKNKELDSSQSAVKIDSTRVEEKPHEDILAKTIQSNPLIIAPATSIMSDKYKNGDKESDTNTDIQPVISEVTQPLVKVEQERNQQIMSVSEKKEELSLDLTTAALKSTSIEKSNPTPTNLMPAKIDESSLVPLSGDDHSVIDKNKTENAKPALENYLNPFLPGFAIWQAWLNMCSEFAAIGASLSLNWIESFWRFLIPSSEEPTDDE